MGKERSVGTFALQRIILLVLAVLLITCNGGEVLSNGLDVDTFVDEIIASSDVVVFAKSYCPYCQKVLALLQKLLTETSREYRNNKSNQWTFQYIELDLLTEDDGPLIQMELLTKTGEKGIPNIFVGGENIIGYDDFYNLYETGDLLMMIHDSIEFRRQKNEEVQ